MENVAKKFRAAIPPHLTINSCVSAQAALNVCRERIFRVVLIDNEIPDVDSAVLMNQLRVLQPHAAFLALALRSVNKVQTEMKELGFDDVLFKPFQPEAIDDLLGRYFDNQELLIKEDNVLKVAGFQGRQDRLEKYYLRVGRAAAGGHRDDRRRLLRRPHRRRQPDAPRTPAHGPADHRGGGGRQEIRPVPAAGGLARGGQAAQDLLRDQRAGRVQQRAGGDRQHERSTDRRGPSWAARLEAIVHKRISTNTLVLPRCPRWR
jgi:CheY-like chemotaxis protein